MNLIGFSGICNDVVLENLIQLHNSPDMLQFEDILMNKLACLVMANWRVCVSIYSPSILFTVIG